MKRFYIKNLLAAMLLLCCAIVSAHDFEVGGIFYNITSSSDLTVEVTYKGNYPNSYNEYSGDVFIPATVTYSSKTYKVTAIGLNAFNDCTGLTSIEIPSGVTTIGESAFIRCTRLTSVTIPNSVTTIGSFAFQGCTRLTSVTIPNSVTTIGDGAFYKCTGLTSVTIPNSVTTIEDGAFQNCSSLTSIEIPSSVTTIGSGAFQNCSSLSAVYINDLAAWIGVDFGDSYSSPLYYAKEIYLNGTLLKQLVIPEGVEEIPAGIFSGIEFYSVTIPSTVLYIGEYAFSNVTKMIILGNTRIRLAEGSDEFYVPAAKRVYVSSFATHQFGIEYPLLSSLFEVGGAKYVLTSTANRTCNVIDCNYDNSAVDVAVDSIVAYKGIALTVKNIEPYSFYKNDSIKSVYINNDGYVGNSAFYQCAGINSDVVVKNNGYVGEHAFYQSSLIGLNISNNGYIGNYAFYDCPKMNSTVTVSNKGYVGEYAFSKSTLTGLNISNDGEIRTSAFRGCTALAATDISNNGYIGTSAFQGCTALAAADISNNDYIGTSAFQGCTALATLNFGENVGAFYDSAFRDCTSLPNIVIPDFTPSVGASCFQNCSSLASAVVGMSVKKLNNSVFQSCTSLTNVSIGVNVDTIKNYVFYGCTSLPKIKILPKVESVGDSVFYACTSLRTVIFDENTVNDTIYLGSNGESPMFSSCPLDTVYIGRRLLYSTESSAGYSPFYENATLRSVHYGNREVAIYPKEYMNCTNLQNVLIGSGINIIDDEAFQNCTSLPTILIPNTVDKPLGASSFKNCSALYKAVIGDSVASIGQSAFESCVSLVDVKVGARVSDIYASAFKKCSSLPQITIPQATNSIKDYVFDDCAKLKYFFLEDGPNAISLGKNAVTASTNVIGSECPLFYDCALDSIYLGRNLSYSLKLEDGYSPFYFNKTLRAVVIGDQATSVHENEFYKCQQLKYVSVGNGVTAIGNWAFSGCISLDHFLFGEGLETIGKEAFSDCTAVTKIVGSRPVPPVCGEQALVDINVFNCTLYVPTASVSAYQAAEQWKDFFFVEGAEKTYTLQYVIDGEVYATYNLVEGAAIEQPVVPTRDGYTFSGWSEIPATMPAGDLTITGSFTLVTYALNFVVDGEVYTTTAMAAGSAIELPAAPAKEGYEFIGWTKADAVVNASNADAVLYTNAPCTETRYGDQFTSWNVLFDGLASTFFHSEYAEKESADGLDHYLRVDMGEGNSVTYFTFTYTNRNTNSVYYAPKVIVVEGSNSANGEYEEIVTLSGLSNVNSFVYNSPKIGNGTAYRYIRYRVTETQYNKKVYNHPYFHIGEFGMTDVELPTTMPAKDVTLVASYKCVSGPCGDNATWLFADGVLTISGSGAMYDYEGNDTPWNSYRFTDITSVVVEEGITHIGNSAFRGFEVATIATLPSTLTSIGVRSFGGSRNIRVSIPANVESIGDNAFNGCTGLTGELSITSVTNIGYQAFLSCSGITSVNLSDNLETIGYGAFSRTGLTCVTIPEGVTTIPAWAFDNCSALTTASLPSTLASIDNYAFENCAALTSITVAYATPATLGESVFNGIGSDATLYVPAGSKAAYEADENWNVIPNIVELVNKYQITYIVDGEVYATEEIVEGSRITPIDAPEKELYEFVEWTGLPTTMPAENIEVVASYKQVAVSITINKYGSATYASPYALDFSEVSGLTAYAATGYNTYTGIITMTKLNTAHEGVGLFLNGTPNTTYVVPIMEDTGDNTLNLMVGVLAKTTVNQTTDDGLYVNFKYTVAGGSTTPMFYRYSNGSSVSAGKAYLQLPQSWLPSDASFAIGIRFEDGFATDIDEVETDAEEVIYYDLNGLRVQEPVKGVVYIVNGKKVIF